MKFSLLLIITIYLLNIPVNACDLNLPPPWRMSPSILTHSAIFMVLLPLPQNVRQHYPYVHH
jgi:hypothetical protein